jgi:hypothetical protein
MIWRAGPLTVTALGLILMGCGSPSTDGHAGPGGAAEPPVAKERRLAPARPYVGKPRPPVTVLLKEQPALESGVPGELRLEVRAGVPLAGLSLTVEGDTGLAVTGVESIVPDSSEREWEAAPLNEKPVAEYRILVTPSTGGSRSVSGQVRFFVGGVEQAAPFRVAVQASGAAPLPTSADKPQADLVRDATGDLIDSMLAETMVR